MRARGAPAAVAAGGETKPPAPHPVARRCRASGRGPTRARALRGGARAAPARAAPTLDGRQGLHRRLGAQPPPAAASRAWSAVARAARARPSMCCATATTSSAQRKVRRRRRRAAPSCRSLSPHKASEAAPATRARARVRRLASGRGVPDAATRTPLLRRPRGQRARSRGRRRGDVAAPQRLVHRARRGASAARRRLVRRRRTATRRPSARACRRGRLPRLRQPAPDRRRRRARLGPPWRQPGVRELGARRPRADGRSSAASRSSRARRASARTIMLCMSAHDDDAVGAQASCASVRAAAREAAARGRAAGGRALQPRGPARASRSATRAARTGASAPRRCSSARAEHDRATLGAGLGGSSWLDALAWPAG